MINTYRPSRAAAVAAHGLERDQAECDRSEASGHDGVCIVCVLQNGKYALNSELGKLTERQAIAKRKEAIQWPRRVARREFVAHGVGSRKSEDRTALSFLY